MEDRHHLKPSRTGHTVMEDVPVDRHSHHHKKTVLVLGVVMSMIIITGLYAASFRYRELVPASGADMSRWGILQESLVGDSKSIIEGFTEISGSVLGLLNANKVRAESIAVMKEKLAESGTGTSELETATSTPETSEPEEHAPTEN